MLKFFRKVRQNLIDKGDAKRYLLYAIGEIFLVVIGILIALQINNWNETRKDRQQEQQILAAILDNLVEDETNLDYATQNFVTAQRAIERIIFPAQVPKDSLTYFFFRAYLFENYVPIRAAFDRSISSGTFDLIQDKQLAQIIQRLYSYELTRSDFQLNILIDIHAEMRAMNRAYDVVELRDPGNQFDASFTMAFNPDRALELLESVAMKKLNKSYYANANMISGQYQYIKSKNKAVQQKIQDYLKTL